MRDLFGEHAMRGRYEWSWSITLVVATTVATALIAGIQSLDPLPAGLRGQYFSSPDWASPVVVSRIERQPSTKSISDAWQGSPPAAFAAIWTGSVIALRPGTYTFATTSDDGSWVFIDGQPVVVNGGHHSEQLVAGSIHLEPGAHTVLIRFFQDGGPFHFDFQWARDGSRLERVPEWALWPRQVTLARALPSLILRRVLSTLEWIWVGSLVVAGALAAWRGALALRSLLVHTSDWPAMRWILLGSVLLNATGVGWGLPARWVPIEVEPEYVLESLSRHFSHGWFGPYPPFHHYLLIVTIGPLLLLEALGRFAFDGSWIYTAMLVGFRLASVVLAAGVVIATCLCGTYAFGKRAGLFAAAMIALTAPFVFYAKTANVDVPYLFWFAVSLVFYLRLLENSRLPDYVLFALSTTLAICTKDQAAALYLFAPIAVIHRIWRANRQAALSHAFWRAVIDRRIVAAAITAISVFALCHNLLFNWNGFLNHVRLIVGPASESYRIFEPTLEGRRDLLLLTIRLIQWSMGWPVFLVCMIGLTIAVAQPRRRQVSVWLLVPVVSYYLGFINPILYNYDRFVLPICLVLALFGGLALDELLSVRRWRWCVAPIGAVFAYTLLYSGTVDALMLRDSRYAAERWMKQHVGLDDAIGISGLAELLPRLNDFTTVNTGTIADLERERPRYFVLNADYSRAVPPETEWGQLIAGLHRGTLGYKLVFSLRRDPPWPWLPGGHPDLVGAREEKTVFSVLRDINPTTEVFRRDAPHTY